MKNLLILLTATILVLGAATAVAEEDPREAEREALRAILADVEKALNTGDYALMKKHLGANVVITYYNGEVTRSPAEMEAYFRRMTEGNNAPVAEFRTTAKVSAPADFYGDDTAVAWGTTQEHYKLTSGMEFDLNGLWTVTLYRSGGEWKIVALHFSTNLFENPLLDNAQDFAWMVGIIAFLSGMIICMLVGRVVRARA